MWCGHRRTTCKNQAHALSSAHCVALQVSANSRQFINTFLGYRRRSAGPKAPVAFTRMGLRTSQLTGTQQLQKAAPELNTMGAMSLLNMKLIGGRAWLLQCTAPYMDVMGVKSFVE